MKITLTVTNFVLLLSLIVGRAHASAQVEIIKYEPGSTDYLTYIVHSWDQGSAIPLDPAYCPVNYGCHVGVAWQVGDPNSTGYIAEPKLAPNETKGSRTIGDLERIWRKKYGYGGTIRKSGGAISAGSKKICFGMKYSRSNSGVKVVPGSECVDVIPGPPVNACYIDGPVYLKHGNVSQNELSGSTTSQSTSVRCLESTLVTISVITGNGSENIYLNPNGSLMSNILVNGKSGSSGSVVTVPGGPRGVSVEFKSILKTNGAVSEGVLTGSASTVLNVW